MFKQLIVLGITSGTIYRVDIPDGRVETLYDKAGPEPDGVVVENGIVYWTTMGAPTPDPSADDGFDFSRPNGGVHAVQLDGSGARDVIPTGAITTGKQLASDGAGSLYWGDREGCRVSRVRIDGTGLADLVVNTRDDTWLQECVGVAVDPARGYLYWTQKGPSNGGKGRIFRAGLEIPTGQTAANRTDIEVPWDGLPQPIDLHIEDDWLYWTDRGDPPTGNTLNRAPIPARGATGSAPEILADGFHEAIGVAVDGEAGVAYVTDLGGQIHVVPIPGAATGSDDARVLADLHEPLSGLGPAHRVDVRVPRRDRADARPERRAGNGRNRIRGPDPWGCMSMFQTSRCLEGALGGWPHGAVALASIPTGRQPSCGIPVSGKTPSGGLC